MWIYVFLAGIVEVFWVIGLRHSSTSWQWLGTIVMIILSFYFVIKACDTLPSGTVYAVFTGMGATGIVLIDFLVFKADFSLAKALFIGLIITGVIGIKLSTEEEKIKERAENKKDLQVNEGGK
ncbi:paired small multidrug resistance pump [Desulfonispora thiosulfatigenes DSM 11270]|uniref:Paired small multidrug resistance pump n=1 Tax=Desulfonispora thiosulfatigenes DSM 11270 TaxID=656914 RepID=A0A1W1UFA8_DESTI|nr:multidrug efflux SMR transporter [Desulfonispora thiosulfatigenes]SMB79491.1 paired small multidrug resistance pump [Desulfonispora thiosulfatigenes DSM 11270]